MILYVCFHVIARPRISKQPISAAFKEGDLNIAVLSCSAVGKGPIFYKWEKYYSPNNTWINPSPRAVNIASSVLKLSVVREEDEGAYRCVATNDDGSVRSKKAFIRTYGECSAA